MLEEIIKAIRSYFWAHKFIVRHKLWKWIWLPGIIYSILFLVGIYFFWTSSASVIEWFVTRSGLKRLLTGESAGFLSFLFLFGRLIVQLLLLMLYFSWFKYFFLILGSPLFAYLSEKTEGLIHNRDYPFSARRFVRDIYRGINIAVRNLFWQTFYTLCMLVLAAIPVLGWVGPVLGMTFECFYLGFSMMDYTNERRGYSASESIEFINTHKGLAVGNGLVFFLLHAIPVVGWIFAPGYSVIAATLSMQQPDRPNLITPIL